MLISKTFDFDAAHLLPNVPPGHKCGKLHGHTYRAEIVLAGEPDLGAGWLCDYAEIERAWVVVGGILDHSYLNDLPGLSNPTTEVLTPWIFQRLRLTGIGRWLKSVRVYESSSTWCEVSDG